jgi:thioredoxin reductase (NADPH)
MSMFDYDTRPATPLPILVGRAASRDAYAIRDFLSRNGYPFEWVDAGQPEAVLAVLGVAEVESSALPLCILPDGSRLASATVEQVAAGLGMVAAPALSEYDLTIIGAGPPAWRRPSTRHPRACAPSSSKRWRPAARRGRRR